MMDTPHDDGAQFPGDTGPERSWPARKDPNRFTFQPGQNALADALDNLQRQAQAQEDERLAAVAPVPVHLMDPDLLPLCGGQDPDTLARMTTPGADYTAVTTNRDEVTCGACLRHIAPGFHAIGLADALEARAAQSSTLEVMIQPHTEKLREAFASLARQARRTRRRREDRRPGPGGHTAATFRAAVEGR